MKRWAAVLAMVLCGCAQPRVEEARAVLSTADGRDAGVAIFRPEGEDSVSVEVQAKNLPPGTHGIHVHEKGECVPPTFESAGGHFNPTGKSHDHAHPQGHHAGDLPNLAIGPDGHGTLRAALGGITMYGRGHHSLFHLNGTSLVIHAAEDDLRSAPSGNAGARLACGSIAPFR